MKNTNKIAFALGGLAGNNAYGAGFLQAALSRGVQPRMVSCTSGQIFWVYQYLMVKQNAKADLRKILEEEISKVGVTQNINIDTAIVALMGIPGAFRPAYPEFMRDLFQNAIDSFRRITSKIGDVFLLQEYLQTIPGRILIPLFSDEFFEKISKTFNDEKKVGIVFNSYNPIEGCEYVHLNEAAKELLYSKKSKQPGDLKKGKKSTYRDRTYFQDISANAVKDGLWLYQYGFDQKSSGFLDGAYFRQIILSELTYANEIYVVRPINYKWLGKLPTNYIGVEDLKTEVAFDGAYAGERYQINLINKLLKDKKLPSDAGYHPIDLKEIEIEMQRGYFGYIFEKLEVFDKAFDQSMRKFDDAQSPPLNI